MDNKNKTMKQTPVELLRFEYRKTLAGVTVNISQAMKLADAFDEANEMFKQEIVDAYQQGFNNAYFSNPLTKEQYYNETFKNK
jgi:hypothetical protein